MSKKVFTIQERARALPAPNHKFPIVVPLELYPAYKQIHNIEPKSFYDQRDREGNLISITAVCQKVPIQKGKS